MLNMSSFTPAFHANSHLPFQRRPDCVRIKAQTGVKPAPDVTGRGGSWGRGRRLLGRTSCAKNYERNEGPGIAFGTPAPTGSNGPSTQMPINNRPRNGARGTREHAACLPGTARLAAITTISQSGGEPDSSQRSFHRDLAGAERAGTEAERERIPSVTCAPDANTSISTTTTAMHNGFCLHKKLIVAGTFNYAVFL